MKMLRSSWENITLEFKVQRAGFPVLVIGYLMSTIYVRCACGISRTI